MSLVAELVGDSFEWDAGVGHQRCGAVAKHVRCPTLTEFGGGDHSVELGTYLRRVGGGADDVREDEVVVVVPPISRRAPSSSF